MVTWIPSIYPLDVSIYASTMDPSWDMVCSWYAEVRTDQQSYNEAAVDLRFQPGEAGSTATTLW